MPNGASRSSSSARSSDSASPGATASIRTSGRRSSGVSTSAACATNAARNASTSSRGDRQARGGLVAAVAQQVAGARRAGRRAGRSAGSSAPSRCPPRRRARSAPPGGGGARRSARRRCRSRPGASPRRRARGASPARVLGDQRLGLEADPGLDVAALGVDARRARRRRRGRARGPRSAAARARRRRGTGGPAAFRRGPSRKPIAALVEPARVHARDLHQRPQAGLARGGQRAQALAHEAAVLALQRHDVGDGGQRDEVQVLVGQRAGPPPRRPAAPARACSATPAAHRSGHG